jgi:hypothetical protein
MKSKLLKLAKMLLNFKIISSDKGSLIIDSEIAIGSEISIEGENGEVLPAADGEYIVDNQKITVEGGKVAAIEPIESEEETATETEEKLEETATETETSEPDEKDLRIEELEGLLKDRDAVIEELTAKLKELEEKLNQPVEDPIKMAATVKEKTTKANGALKYFEK